jgi:hypothetical protein
MRQAFRPAAVLLFTIFGVSLIAQTPASNSPPRKVLFIGNSLTYFQDGIYTHFQKMGEWDTPRLAIQADKAVVGGQYFKTLFDRFPEPRQAIAKGYDFVVLQEDLPETTVADFREYARKFVAEIRKTGARPVLLMAWPYKRLGWISMAQIAQAHRDAAKELSVDVAPVGLAWERAARERPDLDLFIEDRERIRVFTEPIWRRPSSTQPYTERILHLSLTFRAEYLQMRGCFCDGSRGRRCRLIGVSYRYQQLRR